MSEIISFAKRELDLAFKPDEDDDELQREYNQDVANAVLELLQKMSDQGHSGFSASMAISIFSKLARFEPLTPLTGEDWEWTDLGYDDEMKYQNKRCPHVFKREDGTAYDSNALVFIDPDGFTYTASDSRKDITFPYTPTVEYVHRSN
jgi:hypothetical protein